MESERLEYKAHNIELRDRATSMSLFREDEQELLLDSNPLRYLQMPDGQYVLEDYAYESSDDLLDLAKRYVDYLERVERVRRDRKSP
jgi:hypothetical protein